MGAANDVQPSPEARLITQLRESPPRMSMREAALTAKSLGYEISPSTWEQVEKGSRMERGIRQPRGAPPETYAKMALIVGAAPDDFIALGRADIAGELEYLLEELEQIHASTSLTTAHKRILDRQVRMRLRRSQRH